MKFKKTIVGAILVLGAASVPVVEVPENYYVREGPAAETQFSEVERSHDIKGLTEAHIIGEACYNEFRMKGEKTIRKRIDCEEHFKRRDIPGYPMPAMEGRIWGGYSTYLFDTPSGDLDEGFYAKSERNIKIPAAQATLEALTPTADAAVAFSAQTSLSAAAVNTVSYSHTAPASGTLVVASLLQDGSGAQDRKTNYCTYNSVDMFYTLHNNYDVGGFTITVFSLHSPTSGANTVFCQFNDTAQSANVPGDGTSIATSFSGADLMLPVEATATNSGFSAIASVSITTKLANSLIADFMLTDEVNTSDIIPAGDLHTEGVEISLVGENALFGYAGPVVSAGATTTSWTWTGDEQWAHSALSIKTPCPDFTFCTDIITTTGTTTWNAPALTNVTSVSAACWGAGGGGAGDAATGNGGSGGGAYASTTNITVTGNSLTVYVAPAAAEETNGEASYIYNGATYSPIACGGTATATITGGAGGTTACSVGSAAESAGGAGGNGTDSGDTGGGGGGAGGPDGTGSVGAAGDGSSGGTGGAGDAGSGGPGGSGGTIAGGNQGATHLDGSGGGGGGDDTFIGGYGGYGGGGGGGEGSGGLGGQGMCLISYTPVADAGGGRRILWPQ